VARGWESKSVEEQVNSRENESSIPEKNKPSRKEIERNTKRQSILLSRSRTISALQATRDERYRALLQRTLTFLDSELAKL
jgi:hypothetical protein